MRASSRGTEGRCAGALAGSRRAGRSGRVDVALVEAGLREPARDLIGVLREFRVLAVLEDVD